MFFLKRTALGCNDQNAGFPPLRIGTCPQMMDDVAKKVINSKQEDIVQQ
jgi:hypothetical protein